MGVFWGWGFRKNNDQEVKDLKTKVDANTANIVNLENTKATKSYVDSKLPVFINRQTSLPNGTATNIAINQNARPILVYDAHNKFYNDWSYNVATNVLTIRNYTDTAQTFTCIILELNN